MSMSMVMPSSAVLCYLILKHVPFITLARSRTPKGAQQWKTHVIPGFQLTAVVIFTPSTHDV